MEYFILIYCPGRSNVWLEEAEASLRVMCNGINRNKYLKCENQAQKGKAQPQFRLKHSIFLNKISVTTIAALKKQKKDMEATVLKLFIPLYVDMLYLTLKPESLTLNYTNFEKN